MALLFYTGFDYYDQTQTGRIWPYYAGGTSLVPGRFGGRGWLFNNESGYLSTLTVNASTMVVGLALSFASGNATNPFLVFQDATASRTSPISQVDVRLTADGAFQFTRNGTVIATSPSYVFTFGAWNYIEIKVNMDLHYRLRHVEGRWSVIFEHGFFEHTGQRQQLCEYGQIPAPLFIWCLHDEVG